MSTPTTWQDMLSCVTVGTDDFDLSTEVARLRAGDLCVGEIGRAHV